MKSSSRRLDGMPAPGSVIGPSPERTARARCADRSHRIDRIKRQTGTLSKPRRSEIARRVAQPAARIIGRRRELFREGTRRRSEYLFIFRAVLAAPQELAQVGTEDPRPPIPLNAADHPVAMHIPTAAAAPCRLGHGASRFAMPLALVSVSTGLAWS
jgi:hypothetical protein